jgi:phospho-N-acetylmuramoyl-pentapeptide-transferase
MLYYLGLALEDDISVLNVFTYHTVRAGGAAATAFLLSLILGPLLIRVLRRIKFGQFIKQEHVADLHALHKGKAGTPTMGGAMIILSAIAALLLWGDLNNRLLLAAMMVLVALGMIGFWDDYTSLKKKRNHGISARAKFAGQITIGLVLGGYLVYNPIVVGADYLTPRDVLDWEALASELRTAANETAPSLAGKFADHMGPEAAAGLAAQTGPVEEPLMTDLLRDMNDALYRTDLYAPALVDKAKLNGEGGRLVEQGVHTLQRRERVRLNRILAEAAFPGVIAQSPRDLHTKVEVPGFKDWLVPLGAGYIFFVVLIIVSSSNCVNLTDGLDGLAIGASIISLLAYTAIAYVVSRADWSEYLFLVHVPEASELAVFGATLLGAGLGFLWFNCHPAEVFMGDTGSLALGGAIGTMAILTKQELLFVIVGGLFVIEGASVIIQVISFQLTGKRVFRMSPLHHHFELKGWSESKVTIRFWILALMFALMSLATLKLR